MGGTGDIGGGSCVGTFRIGNPKKPGSVFSFCDDSAQVWRKGSRGGYITFTFPPGLTKPPVKKVRVRLVKNGNRKVKIKWS